MSVKVITLILAVLTIAGCEHRRQQHCDKAKLYLARAMCVVERCDRLPNCVLSASDAQDIMRMENAVAYRCGESG